MAAPWAAGGAGRGAAGRCRRCGRAARCRGRSPSRRPSRSRCRAKAWAGAAGAAARAAGRAPSGLLDRSGRDQQPWTHRPSGPAHRAGAPHRRRPRGGSVVRRHGVHAPELGADYPGRGQDAVVARRPVQPVHWCGYQGLSALLGLCANGTRSSGRGQLVDLQGRVLLGRRDPARDSAGAPCLNRAANLLHALFAVRKFRTPVTYTSPPRSTLTSRPHQVDRPCEPEPAHKRAITGRLRDAGHRYVASTRQTRLRLRRRRGVSPCASPREATGPVPAPLPASGSPVGPWSTRGPQGCGSHTCSSRARSTAPARTSSKSERPCGWLRRARQRAPTERPIPRRA